MKVNLTGPSEIFLAPALAHSLSTYIYRYIYLSIFVVLRAQNVTNQTIGYKIMKYYIQVSFNFAINFSGTRKETLKVDFMRKCKAYWNSILSSVESLKNF